MKKFLKAFTVAELLLVMSIIGVIAAFAIPMLRTNLSDEEAVARVRKINTGLQNAYLGMTELYGEPAGWYTDETSADDAGTKFINNILQFLNYSSYSGSTIYLKDGAELKFSIYSGSTIRANARNYTSTYYPQSIGYVTVDVDGSKKGYNLGGRDIFNFMICKNGIVPSGYDDYGNLSSVSANGNSTAWVVRIGNLDYLQCNDLYANSTGSKLTCD